MNPAEFPTILIVDDERFNRMALAELLKDECRVLLAKDGLSALFQVAAEPDIKLILLDVTMPEMDGYEVLRQLQSSPHTADISVIFISGQTGEEDEERGLLLGAVDYLTKPIRPAIVRARIRNHLNLIRQRRKLEQLSQQDSLTCLANRRHFDLAFDQAYHRGIRTREHLCLAMIDVDHFKLYNDHYGHGAGDEALRRIAQTLADATRRPDDLASRYGGEEFVLLIPGPTKIEQILEQVRQNVEDLAIPHERSFTATVLTVSCGAVIAIPELTTPPDSLLRHADAALYQSKRAGRNRTSLVTLNFYPDSSAAELASTPFEGGFE